MYSRILLLSTNLHELTLIFIFHVSQVSARIFFCLIFSQYACSSRGENLKTLKTSGEVIEVFDILEGL